MQIIFNVKISHSTVPETFFAVGIVTHAMHS